MVEACDRRCESKVHIVYFLSNGGGNSNKVDDGIEFTAENFSIEITKEPNNRNTRN